MWADMWILVVIMAIVVIIVKAIDKLKFRRHKNQREENDNTCSKDNVNHCKRNNNSIDGNA